MKDKADLEFRGGLFFSTIPIWVFLVFCILFFVVFRAFDMEALAMGGFVGLLIAAPFAKSSDKYWGAVMKGIGSPTSIAIVVILLVIGIFTRLMAVSGVSQGFVWLANQIGIQGGLFTGFTFLAACLIATATGSSIGTMFAAFPILYPAGILMGCNPAVLAGAIVSGAIFGDNLAPISDVTIASTGTQTFANKEAVDIAGVVAYRLKYAVIAGVISTVLFVIMGGGGNIGEGAKEILQNNMNPKGLLMLIPVVVLLVFSIKTRDIFKSVSAGIVTGIVVGLVSGIFTFGSIISVKDGAVQGFVYDGFKSMIGISVFCISLFGILGVMEESGAMRHMIDWLAARKMAKTVKGTEILIGLGSLITTAVLGGVTSASVLTFGPVVNELGSYKNIHPYRRANFLTGYANSLSAIIPFISAFIFIAVTVTNTMAAENSYIPVISPIDISVNCFYPIILFIILSFSVLTGWDRKFENIPETASSKAATK